MTRPQAGRHCEEAPPPYPRCGAEWRHEADMRSDIASAVQTCRCCGLLQHVPPVPPRMRACCPRCATALPLRATTARNNSRTAALALAALVLYPLAVSQPMLLVKKFGHLHESSILEGITSLLGSGHLVVGLIVLLCSVVFPLGKLLALLVLSAGGWRLRSEHRALTYHVVEWAGRWGMLDVLLVAILVAVLKIGDFLDVAAGPAALAFCSCVVLSLLATAVFDPHLLWDSPIDENGEESLQGKS